MKRERTDDVGDFKVPSVRSNCLVLRWLTLDCPVDRVTRAS